MQTFHLSAFATSTTTHAEYRKSLKERKRNMTSRFKNINTWLLHFKYIMTLARSRDRTAKPFPNDNNARELPVILAIFRILVRASILVCMFPRRALAPSPHWPATHPNQKSTLGFFTPLASLQCKGIRHFRTVQQQAQSIKSRHLWEKGKNASNSYEHEYMDTRLSVHIQIGNDKGKNGKAVP